MEKLSLAEVNKQLAELTGWQVVEEKWLTKRYRFRKYLDGIEFVSNIANHAERENHHPFISIDYRVVTIKLTSWNAGGITALDMKSIEEYDAMYQAYQKK